MDQPTGNAPGPLSHLRVLDFTALVQGPLATQILGDLGADVVKIERVEGEWSRHWGILDGHTHGQTDSFLAFNRNKRSVTADLKDEQARERILALAAEFDVVVENFRPGVMARLGLGYEAFAERNPAIIFVSSSGYGQTGPYVTRPGQDMLIQALTGMLWLTGRDARSAHRLRRRDRGPVHRAAHRDRHPGRAGAPAPDRPGAAGRAGPVQLHDLGPAAGTDLLPEPRFHPAAPGREPRIYLGHRAIRALPDRGRRGRHRHDPVPHRRPGPRPARTWPSTTRTRSCSSTARRSTRPWPPG